MILYPMLKKTLNGYEKMSFEEQCGIMREDELFQIKNENRLYKSPVQQALLHMEILNPSKSYEEKGLKYIKSNPIKL